MMLRHQLYLAFKKLYPSGDWTLPFAKLFSAPSETKTEQLWQCNSIKRAYLISLVSHLKCFWSHYPNCPLSVTSALPPCWGLPSLLVNGSSSTERRASVFGKVCQGQTGQQEAGLLICLKSWGTQTPSSNTQLLHETSKSHPYPMPQFPLLQITVRETCFPHRAHIQSMAQQ